MLLVDVWGGRVHGDVSSIVQERSGGVDFRVQFLLEFFLRKGLWHVSPHLKAAANSPCLGLVPKVPKAGQDQDQRRVC